MVIISYKFSTEELEQLLTDYNKIAIKERNINLPEEAFIWDETLRDGEQSPTVYLTLDEKIHLAKLMDDIGVKLIAVGFPAVTKQEKNIVKAIVNENLRHSTILGIARPRKPDIDACIDADLEEIVVFMPVSRIFRRTLKHTDEQQIERRTKEVQIYAEQVGRRAKEQHKREGRAERNSKRSQTDPTHYRQII